ncbi:MAG: ArsR/SmtB family transcription factor [Myxococcota bacterium]|jgi:DNA-binding transcriptional ArsR family regulator|nr:winged helix-turn-helix transcriptional regulator [Myxococcota bacterium]HHW96731.1 winged helix-turn-helix transcriptional regulator [Oligoflexales bacterium]MBP8971308.1 winged helix-turn-helix transcriptional regulator [Myxococcota bacterium]HOE83030.1 metalloregulator ArsR/SmtB family transcription factor [Myxococcota bacterium]HON25633.1 metalloregulator ArsR/SmtB family transcription factor [Myxococcota bacterium]
MAISKINQIPPERLKRIMDIMKSVANPLRFRIICLLCDRPHKVGEMAELLNERQAAVSQHLAPLRMLGLVAVDRTGGTATYSLKEPLLRSLVNCFESHFLA